MSSENENPTFKVSLMGPASVGKTSILLRFTKNNFFQDQTPTVGAAFASVNLETSKGQINLNIWDTAGQERYRSLVPQYARGSSAIILVFDVSNKKTFDGAIEIFEKENENFTGTTIWYLVGNKTDLLTNPDDLNFNQYIQYAQEKKITFIATSAKTGDNVPKLFQQIGDSLANTIPEDPCKQASAELVTSEEPIKKNCC